MLSQIIQDINTFILHLIFPTDLYKEMISKNCCQDSVIKAALMLCCKRDQFTSQFRKYCIIRQQIELGHLML